MKMELKEVKLNIHESGEYKNLYLNEIAGNGDFIILEKVDFADARMLTQKDSEEPLTSKFGDEMFSCTAMYGEDKITFILYKSADEWNGCGDLGDKVKLIRKKEMYVDAKGKDRIKSTLLFEKVN